MNIGDLNKKNVWHFLKTYVFGEEEGIYCYYVNGSHHEEVIPAVEKILQQYTANEIEKSLKKEIKEVDLDSDEVYILHFLVFDLQLDLTLSTVIEKFAADLVAKKICKIRDLEDLGPWASEVFLWRIEDIVLQWLKNSKNLADLKKLDDYENIFCHIDQVYESPDFQKKALQLIKKCPLGCDQMLEQFICFYNNIPEESSFRSVFAKAFLERHNDITEIVYVYERVEDSTLSKIIFHHWDALIIEKINQTQCIEELEMLSILAPPDSEAQERAHLKWEEIISTK